MKTKMLYMLLIAIFALSSCQKSEEIEKDLKPVFSQITTYPAAIIENRNTIFSCNVSNFDSKSGLAKVYIKIDDGMPMEQKVEDGKLSTTMIFYSDTKITYMASYWDYESQEYKYVEQPYDIKLQEPYFRNFIFGDELDYIYSVNKSLDFNNPEKRGDAIYYDCYDGSEKEASDFDFYYFTDSKLSAAGRTTHLDPRDVFEEGYFNNIGDNSAYFTDAIFKKELFYDITNQPLEVIYAEGFTPSAAEADVIQQVVDNMVVSDDDSLRIVTDLVLSGKVQFSLEITLNSYPDLRFISLYTVHDYTPEGKLSREYTLIKKR